MKKIKLRYTIKVLIEVDADDFSAVEDILEEGRNYGSAEIEHVEVVEDR